jgi:hypothetical protein
MSVNGINGMQPRMATNLTIGRQTTNTNFGARVQAGLDNAAGAVGSGLGAVAGMVPGGNIVSAAVSSVQTMGNTATPGSMSQYSGLSASASGITGVPSINTNVGGPGFVGGSGGSTGGSNYVGTPTGGVGGSVGGNVASNVTSDPQLNNMFAQQKQLLGLQAQISNESNTFSAISNVMKARSDAHKNAIGNVR